jgi:hypothetical protein
MRRSIVFTLFVVAAGTLTALAQTVSLRPGKYETTAEMDFSGMKMQPEKDTQCITPDDLKDFSKLVMDPEQSGCKASGHKFTANKVTFETERKEDDLQMAGTVEMTFTADSFTGLMTMKDNKGRTTSIKTTAKRTGECTR